MSGAAVSRRDRGVSRKKCPPFDEAEVSKAAPLIKTSWARAMEKHGYFELGLLYYDTVFAEAQDIAPMFTLERERMGAKFIDMFGVGVFELLHIRTYMLIHTYKQSCSVLPQHVAIRIC
jgi:hypothetical protein